MNELISVIVPVYNVEDYISECIESILNQTYNTFELLIINDGSTDSSLDKVLAFNDSRIKLIDKENEGLSSARNIGMELANGKYITFIDSDDFITPYFLEKTFNLIGSEKSDMVLVQHTREIKLLSGNNDKHKFRKISRYEALKNNAGYNCISFITVWGKLYSKRVLENLLFPVGKVHEDQFFTYKAILNSTNITLMFEKHYFYRYRYNSLSSKFCNIDAKFNLLDAYIEKNDILKKNNYDDIVFENEIKILYLSTFEIFRKYGLKKFKKNFIGQYDYFLNLKNELDRKKIKSFPLFLVLKHTPISNKILLEIIYFLIQIRNKMKILYVVAMKS